MHNDLLIFLRTEKRQLEDKLSNLSMDQKSDRHIFEDRLKGVLKALDVYYAHIVNDSLASGKVVTRRIYALLQDELNVEIKSAPDEWTDKYGLDFCIDIDKGKLIGIQIKSVSNENINCQKWTNSQLDKHTKFKNKYHGSVFIVYSKPVSFLKQILNIEILTDINTEINELRHSS